MSCKFYTFYECTNQACRHTFELPDYEPRERRCPLCDHATKGDRVTYYAVDSLWTNIKKLIRGIPNLFR